MAWVRLDDRFYSHRKVLSVSVAARWLYVSALCVANQHANNGVIDRAAQDCLLVAVGRSGSFDALAAELVAANLWEPSGENFVIHDYLQYQPSDEEQRKERAASALRQQRFRERRRSPEAAVTHPVTPLQTQETTPLKTVPRPVPSRPVPSRIEEEAKASFAGGSAPQAGQVALLPDVLAKTPARRTREPKGETKTGASWAAYSQAYERRYGVAPVSNGKVFGQLALLVGQLGAESAAVAAYYVGHSGAYYVTQGHPVGLLVRDCQKLRTEMLTGRSINATTARKNEATAANPFARMLDRRDPPGVIDVTPDYEDQPERKPK